jgi:membrane fusion protein (multidrug efflux system)
MKNWMTVIGGLFALTAFLSGCTDSVASNGMQAPPPQALPVFAVHPADAATNEEYTASLEGTRNVDIRPQVDGYLVKIYQDEGAFVHKGQPLFQIDDKVYQSQLDNAKANLLAAKAAQENAEINVNKLTPLVSGGVVSDVQLKTAQASLDAAKASVAQAEAMVRNAAINVGFTTVIAPVDGYLGRIPFKTGSLVGRNDAQALTVLSQVDEVYAYFSMSEKQFLDFKNRYKGATVEDKIRQIPPVGLVLADGSVYSEKGKVETVEGQFDRTLGSIPFRVLFPNPNGLLRSGNTGRVRMPGPEASVLVVPQESTFDMQDKVMVFALGDSNKVSMRPLVVSGRSGNYYLVSGGLKDGDKLVYTGLDRLKDGAVIVPQEIKLDSLLKASPL